ncbi:MAG: DNA methyltransferase [Marinobacter sp. T13-3]|nr:MAG: DNA methyltransferase [Marinobacter sp. T13-3]
MSAITASNTAFSVPHVVTKQLKMNEASGRKKVRISSNFIQMMGFEPGQRIVAVPSIAGGFDIRPSETGPQKVHTRRYNRQRSNNPLESLIELSSTQLINSTFPPGTERFHTKMTRNQIQVRPIPNRAFNIAKRFKGVDPYRALVAMTGGVDIHCLERAGFKSDVVIEYRPQERRDINAGRNLEEVHALNTTRNGAPKLLINEDIYQINPDQLKQLCAGHDLLSLGVFSIQCDDFSNIKSNTQKARSVQDQSTSIDMVYPVLRNIEVMQYPVTMIENVRGFQDHAAGTILKSMLGRMGYRCHEMVLDARDYGGIQSRTRYYLVATIFPGFEPPQPQARPTNSIWPIIEKHLADCRDVTDTGYIKARARSHRTSRPLTRESTYTPTIVKSQARGIKDGVYIEDGGRVYAPSEGLIQELMSIPDDFDVSWMAQEQAIETLGQSIDYKLHHAVAEAVRQHIELNLGQTPIAKHHHQASLL